MSIHSQIMERIFDTLDDPERKHLIGHTDGWSPEAQEVLAALDAFADEQETKDPIGDFCGNCQEHWPCHCDGSHRMCGICAGSLTHDCRCTEREFVNDAVRREFGEGPEDGWLIGNNVFTNHPEWTEDAPS